MTKKRWKWMTAVGMAGFLFAFLCLATLQLPFRFSLSPFAVEGGKGMQARGERKTGLVMVADSQHALSSLYPMANAAYQNKLPVLLLSLPRGELTRQTAALSQVLQHWEEENGLAPDGVVLLAQGDAAAPVLALTEEGVVPFGGAAFVSPELDVADWELVQREGRFPVLLAGNAGQSGEVLTELFNRMTGSSLLAMGGAYRSTKGMVTVQTIVQNPPFEFSSPEVARQLNGWYAQTFADQTMLESWALVFVNVVWMLLPVFAALALVGVGGGISLRIEGATELLSARQGGMGGKVLYQCFLWLLALPCAGVFSLLFGLVDTGLAFTLTFCVVAFGSYGVTGALLARLGKGRLAMMTSRPLLRRPVRRCQLFWGTLLTALLGTGFVFAALTGLPVRSLDWQQLVWLVPLCVLMGFGYAAYLSGDELLFERQTGFAARGIYLLLQLVPFLLLGLFWLFSGAHPQLFAALFALAWWGCCMLLGRAIGRLCSCIPAGAAVAAVSFCVGLAVLAME